MPINLSKEIKGFETNYQKIIELYQDDNTCRVTVAFYKDENTSLTNANNFIATQVYYLDPNRYGYDQVWDDLIGEKEDFKGAQKVELQTKEIIK